MEIWIGIGIGFVTIKDQTAVRIDNGKRIALFCYCWIWIELLTKVTHQCINLVAAGTEIITVKVLNNIRVV